MVGQGGPRQASARRPTDVPQAVGETAPVHGPCEKRTEGERGQTPDDDAQVPGHQLHAARDQGRHSHIAAAVDQDNR